MSFKITSYPSQILYGDTTKLRLLSYVDSDIYDTSDLSCMYSAKALEFGGEGAEPLSEVEVFLGSSESNLVKLKTVVADTVGGFKFSINLQRGPNFIYIKNKEKTDSIRLNAYHWMLFLTLFASEFKDIWDRLHQIIQNGYISNYDGLESEYNQLYLNYASFTGLRRLDLPSGWTLSEYKFLLNAIGNLWWFPGNIRTIREVIYAFTGSLPYITWSQSLELQSLMKAKTYSEEVYSKVESALNFVKEERFAEAKEFFTLGQVFWDKVIEEVTLTKDIVDVIYISPRIRSIDYYFKYIENYGMDAIDVQDNFNYLLEEVSGFIVELGERIIAATQQDSYIEETYRTKYADGYLSGRLYVNNPPSLNWYLTPVDFVWSGSTGGIWEMYRVLYTSGTVDPNSITYVYIDGEEYEEDNYYGYSKVKTSNVLPSWNYYLLGVIRSSTTAIVGFDLQRRPNQGMYLMSREIWENTFKISLEGTFSDEILDILVSVLSEGKPAHKLGCLYVNGNFYSMI